MFAVGEDDVGLDGFKLVANGMNDGGAIQVDHHYPVASMVDDVSHLFGEQARVDCV